MWCTYTTADAGDWCGMFFFLLNQAWAKRLSRLRTPPETQWGTRHVIIQPTKRRSSTPNSVTTCEHREHIHLHSVGTCRYGEQTLTWTITNIIPLQTCSWVPKTWKTIPWTLFLLVKCSSRFLKMWTWQMVLPSCSRPSIWWWVHARHPLSFPMQVDHLGWRFPPWSWVHGRPATSPGM